MGDISLSRSVRRTAVVLTALLAMLIVGAAPSHAANAATAPDSGAALRPGAGAGIQGSGDSTTAARTQARAAATTCVVGANGPRLAGNTINVTWSVDCSGTDVGLITSIRVRSTFIRDGQPFGPLGLCIQAGASARCPNSAPFSYLGGTYHSIAAVDVYFSDGYNLYGEFITTTPVVVV